MQIPDHLVQRGREGAIDVEEEALALGDLQRAAQVQHDGLEALGGADLADVAAQLGRRAPHGLEPHHDLAVPVVERVAGAGEGRARVPRERRQHRARRHGQGEVRGCRARRGGVVVVVVVVGGFCFCFQFRDVGGWVWGGGARGGFWVFHFAGVYEEVST